MPRVRKGFRRLTQTRRADADADEDTDAGEDLNDVIDQAVKDLGLGDTDSTSLSTSDGTADTDGTVDDGDADGGRATGTVADLINEADAEEFDATFRVTSDLEPFASGDSPAIPRPWQGLPRIAITYNLNFVWDDDNDEWVRDTGNSGGLLSRLADGTETVNTGTFTRVATGIADPTRNVLATAGVTDAADVTSDFSPNIDDGGAFSPNVLTFPRWDESAGEWDVLIQNESGFNATFEWQLLEVAAP